MVRGSVLECCLAGSFVGCGTDRILEISEDPRAGNAAESGLRDRTPRRLRAGVAVNTKHTLVFLSAAHPLVTSENPTSQHTRTQITQS